MTQRPISYPRWTSGPGPNVIQPASELANTGWDPGQAPDAENVNWQLWDIDQWIEYLDGVVSNGLPNSWMRLINGGNFSFNASTGVLAWSATMNISIPGTPDAANAIAAGNVTLADGQVAYTNGNVPIVSLGNTDGATAQITGMNFTGNISIGDSVSGAGIPGGTTILGVGPSSVTLSANTTSANTQASYTFYGTSALTVLVANESSLLPDNSQILLAKRAGNVIYLGINCSQMVLRDGEFKTLIGSGYFSIYQSVAGQNLSKGQLVYISPGSADGGRTAGALYPLDTSLANQSVRGVYAGVVITDVSTSGQATVLFSGFFLGTSLTPGALYYADPSNPGGITATQPTGAGQKIVPVGFAISSTVILYTGAQAQAGVNTSFPVFDSAFLTNTGDNRHFTLPNIPLNAGSVFLYFNGLIIPNTEWSLAGQTVDFGSAQSPDFIPYAKYILADQSFLAGYQEAPTNPSGDRQTWILNGPAAPININGTFVYVDGLQIDNTQFSLVTGANNEIIFNAPLALSQAPYVAYFMAATIEGAAVTGLQNIGTGAVLFAGMLGTTAQIKSLVAGANVSFSISGNSITINSSGGGGGGTIEAHGSAASPVAIDPTVGIVPTSANDQVWWVTPSTGSGAVPITASPAIAAGVTIGQRITLKSIASANYLKIPNTSGTDMNGDCAMGPVAQSLELMWDGGVWSENDRRI